MMKSKEAGLIESLKQYGVQQLCFIDAGAKGSLDHIALLDTITGMLAFEPQPREASLLREKYREHPFKSLEIKTEALGDKPGTAPFFITGHNSMSSLLPEDIANYEMFFGRNEDFDRWKQCLTRRNEVTVQVTTIDETLSQQAIDYIDYLKLDTQGYELRILEGAAGTLSEHKAGVIRTEVAFVSTYHGQPLFSDIDVYLKKVGYMLVDCLFHQAGYIPSVNSKKIKEKPDHSPNADAIYVLKPEYLERSRAVSAAVILASKGYISLAEHILQKQNIPATTISSWLMKLTQQTFRKRVKHFLGNHLPPSLFYYLGKRKV